MQPDERLIRLAELEELIKPLWEIARADERKRCAKIARGLKSWDGEEPTRKNINRWGSLMVHGEAIAQEIGKVSAVAVADERALYEIFKAKYG